MKRVICISPHFPPVNAPDMHRLRTSLTYLREFGWEPVVFSVDPRQVEGRARDELLQASLPANIQVIQVGAIPWRLTRLVGVGNLGFRCWFPLRNAVSAYLAREHADLVLFSTTVFSAVAHGRYWKRRFGVPFVVDLQDPWRNDYYLTLPPNRRPKKFWFDHLQRSRLEALTMKHADGMIAVSDAYIQVMRARYPSLESVPARTVPFGADERDFELAASPSIANRVFAKVDGVLDVVFAGVVPPSMARSIRPLFLALRALRDRGPLHRKVRLHFVGTDYGGDGKSSERVMPIARACGVEDLVFERTERYPFFEVLRMLSDADLLLLLGTEDATYSASKFAQTAMSRRPTFAIFEESSPILKALADLGSDSFVAYSPSDSAEAIAGSIASKLASLFERLPFTPTYDDAQLRRHHARERTSEIVALLDDAVLSAWSRADGPRSATSESPHGAPDRAWLPSSTSQQPRVEG